MGGVEPYQSAPLTSHNPSFPIVMSQHKSLQGSSGLVVKRNVLKRFERVDLLKKRGQWKAGDRVQGLRKTKPDV
jgi:small basic protein (TIGR04137 family)